ncbi:hypothetical protein LX64_04203 [Chitinophaga skermanii]|uniref:YD repeat-containing protein n=1 Tax=Chitinophaga skermanii TaxID=331697 RepID=A0A327Q7C5_9BACT|nr:hypothetical protein [Chitinophaga skermanii]RAJ00496.1 hypothetical protein LX64_04203 [Chitinophaga skermanii]
MKQVIFLLSLLTLVACRKEKEQPNNNAAKKLVGLISIGSDNTNINITRYQYHESKLVRATHLNPQGDTLSYRTYAYNNGVLINASYFQNNQRIAAEVFNYDGNKLYSSYYIEYPGQDTIYWKTYTVEGSLVTNFVTHYPGFEDEEHVRYTYTNGNMTESETHDTKSNTTIRSNYEYDTNPNPFYEVQGAQLVLPNAISKNNIVKIHRHMQDNNDGKYNIVSKYVYRGNGYPGKVENYYQMGTKLNAIEFLYE